MTPGPDQLTAARLALADLGMTIADLEPHRHPDRPPTFSEYLPVVIAAAGTGAHRTYGTYWGRMATLWGDRRLDEVHASDIEAMKNTAATTARSRRTTRHGRHAGEHVVAAARAIYNRAIADGLIDQKDSPAHRVAKPRRLPNTRRALTAWEIEQINTTTRDRSFRHCRRHTQSLPIRVDAFRGCKNNGSVTGCVINYLDLDDGAVRVFVIMVGV